ncbi:hypothetical protein [Parasitella parasitica]|uniref:Uncharacterized protein n=1 Tax=Parasitella parasitica TaxID=35722 RepID=A0A0B7NB84_9FUNG|nr:hypothetical protein [Parasitella parasitica]
MPFSNSTLPTSHTTATAMTKSWRDKLFDIYVWCKFISLGLNLMYMVCTFEVIYNAGSAIAAHQQRTENYNVPVQYGFQILIGCLMMFCLIIDLIVLTTSKLAIADWYWRPGVFFFTFTCGKEIISLIELLFNDDKFNENCQQRLGSGFRGGPLVLISEICVMQNQLNHIFDLGRLVRDVLICSAYVTAGYFYVNRLVQVLKRRESTDTIAMRVMANSYRYPITQ